MRKLSHREVTELAPGIRFAIFRSRIRAKAACLQRLEQGVYLFPSVFAVPSTVLTPVSAHKHVHWRSGSLPSCYFHMYPSVSMPIATSSNRDQRLQERQEQGPKFLRPGVGGERDSELLGLGVLNFWDPKGQGARMPRSPSQALPPRVFTYLPRLVSTVPSSLTWAS